MARSRRRSILVPEWEGPDAKPPAPPEPEPVQLPDRAVLQAGVKKFIELAGLHWPDPKGGFHLTSFDIRNTRQLAMTLGLVYMAMADEQRRAPDPE